MMAAATVGGGRQRSHDGALLEETLGAIRPGATGTCVTEGV